LKSLVLGLSTRKQKKFFNSFIGDSVSHTTASRLVNEISYLLNQYRNKPLVDQYKYLYLDAIWVHLKELDIKNRPVLVALGIKKDGSKDILAFKLANSESEKEWLGLINDLYRRGLEGFKLELIISDNCPGLKSAISYVYPYTQLQLCTVHKLRNILGKIKNKKKNRKKLMQQASNVFKSKSKNQAITRYNKFLKDWKDKEPAAVKTMKRDIQYYLTYFNFPQEKRNSLKSTNPLERINREMRKITRRFGYFQSQKSLDIYLYLFLKEEKLIIDEQKEDVPDENKKIASLEFANNS
ncbi:MAG: IS256 family transposase, partial [Candidatus Omnitrophica bacterium]|nr:IS256 family transposase [Candidatus Omnitrophota bacterium]